ncbi:MULTISPECIES: ABC transporter ATP-binding protein [Cytobacillus]|uniref:ABC transporter ATP-binding protein n=1 Tax=Cytobacillus stercorigallinarum TaxID=2762240 RepID=A0ABR8QR15_9BACI|nr:ABC transporter ATP-binding protein [Cytobacillus stercorigallinarum]MBD7937960.1 ABC transporter ATP-binding protein [Cytobacillus stercorigallinarum]
MIASLNGIVKRYDSKLVLDYIDLEINEGQIIGLLGPNGAGKSTLIRCLTGMETVNQGNVTLFGDGKKPFQNKNKEKIGLVTQEISIFPELTAKENANFFAGVYGLKGEERKRRVAEALAFVGLAEQTKGKAQNFSGGMQRRLNIACSLVHNPKLLIMDEPTVGIDTQSRNHILQAVKQLQSKGTTILYTTHYMEEVEAIASEVVILDKGQIITKGTVQELIQNIQHEEKIKVEVSHPEEVSLANIQALPDVKQVIKDGNQILIVTSANSGHLDRILTIIKEDSGVVGINVEKPNLEDVFLTLTGRTLRDGGSV